MFLSPMVMRDKWKYLVGNWILRYVARVEIWVSVPIYVEIKP